MGIFTPIVSSWASGQGQPISTDQIQAALPADHLEQIASQLGVSPQNALAALAEHLPGLAAQAKS